jgi:hypothetical protein
MIRVLILRVFGRQDQQDSQDLLPTAAAINCNYLLNYDFYII